MSAVFKVGDVCVGQNFVLDVEYNGMECTITSPLEMRYWVGSDGKEGEGVAYGVIWENGVGSDGKECCFPCNIRKKHPPCSDKAVARQAMLDCIAKAKEPVREPA